MFAWSVHLLTAIGTLVGFLALRATVAGDLREAFLWLAVATAIDAADGGLARAARVKERTPTFNGARLDDIVDYLTFVFVPAFMAYHARLLPEPVAVPVVAAMLLSSAYGFSQEAAKTADHFFTGFPSYWNIVVFYLVVIGAAPAVNALVLAVLAVLVFVPIGYVYPSRTPTLRRVTIPLGVVWALLVVALIWQFPAVSRFVLYASLVFPAYYTVLSFVLHARRARRASE